MPSDGLLTVACACQSNVCDGAGQWHVTFLRTVSGKATPGQVVMCDPCLRVCLFETRLLTECGDSIVRITTDGANDDE